MEEAIVQCFGVPDRHIRNIGKLREAQASEPSEWRRWKSYEQTVEIYNPRKSRWEKKVMSEYLKDCPVCRTHMRVQALDGKEFFACCSDVCYDKIILKEGGHEKISISSTDKKEQQ